MGTSTTLGGFTVLGSSVSGWALRPGVEPSTGLFDLVPDDASSLLSGPARPVTLRIESENGDISISGLYPLHYVAGPNPYISRVLVADRRWMWARQHVLRRYNWRRHIGVKRVVTEGEDPVNFDPVADVAYAPWSLKDGKPYTAQQALDDIVEQIEAAEEGFAAGGFSVEDFDDAIPIENLEVDEGADSALSRVLDYLPEAQVTVDPDGTARIYSRANGADEEIVDGAPPQLAGSDTLAFVDQRRVRPKEVHVLFSYEAEVRFDHEERDLGWTGEQDPADRVADNVLASPDFALSIGGTSYAQGTWLNINTAINAWGSPPGRLSMSSSYLRKAFVPFMDMWAPMLLAGTRDPDADWISRIAALQQHWRKTYKINRRWIDRIFQLNAYRVSTIDPATGTRAPAAAYANYALVYSQRSMIDDIQESRDLSYVINVEAYPEPSGSEPTRLSAMRPAPATVSILDHDQGIVRLDYRTDQTRMHQMILPGNIANIPSGDMADRGRKAIAFNAVFESASLQNIPQLTGNHRVTFVLSAIPASPNTDQQLYRVVVKPDEVASLLPGNLAEGLGAGDGPVMEVRIGVGRETARVAWSDRKSELIEDLFGVTELSDEAAQDLGGIESLIINRGEQSAVGNAGASVDAIAQAAAARVYAEFTDRWQGDTQVGGSYDAKVDGFLDELVHQTDSEGNVTTKIRTGSQPPRFDFRTILPGDVRAILMRLALPGKSA